MNAHTVTYLRALGGHPCYRGPLATNADIAAALNVPDTLIIMVAESFVAAVRSFGFFIQSYSGPRPDYVNPSTARWANGSSIVCLSLDATPDKVLMLRPQHIVYR